MARQALSLFLPCVLLFSARPPIQTRKPHPRLPRVSLLTSSSCSTSPPPGRRREVDVEMQSRTVPGLKSRLLFYCCRLHAATCDVVTTTPRRIPPSPSSGSVTCCSERAFHSVFHLAEDTRTSISRTTSRSTSWSCPSSPPIPPSRLLRSTAGLAFSGQKATRNSKPCPGGFHHGRSQSQP